MTHNPRILTSIQRQIAESATSSIPFSEFMDFALYGSDDAYYRKTERPVGRKGDFFTSVSVGKAFGILLAEWIIARWEELGSPDNFHLIEQGAHDGTLMIDILDHIGSRLPDNQQSFRGLIVEPFDTVRERQGQNVANSNHSQSITWVSGLDEIANASLSGVIYCNELLDAFPVERIQRVNGEWQQLHVVSSDISSDAPFTWHPVTIPATSPLATHIAATDGLVDADLPDGYITELNPAIKPWIAAVSRVLKSGSVLVIDYGFGHEDYYHSTRTDGTLRTYFQHKAIDDPFQHVGDSDITAHVDFSWLEKCAADAGLHPRPLIDQGKFLIDASRDWLLSLEQTGHSADPAALKLLRQINTLTHPGSMGRKFKVQVIDFE